jgi:asparagine synthase (glutamine-hydrolysing)
MSAHAGIFYFDGRAVPPQTIDALTTACQPYGPDDGGHSCPSPGVGLIYRALQVTLEDRFERQPLRLADGRILVWDGRLDNRTDLMMELGLPPSRGTPDSQIVGEACQRWGDEACRRLTGDWSFAIWDPQHRQVTLACDFVGARALYYVVTESYSAWATALEGLVDLTGRRTDFDDDYLYATATQTRLPSRTPYRGIARLLAGHLTHINDNGTPTSKRFWRLPADVIRYRDRRDYAVHLRAIFRDAVAARLRSSHPVWMELSGGWDSSTIVCMAARIAAEGGGACTTPSLSTLSYTTPGSLESDETRFVDAVSAHTGLPNIKIEVEHTAPPNFPVPIHLRDVNPAIERSYDRMRQASVRVLTTGIFGDPVMGNYALDLTSIVWSIRQLKPVAFLRALREWSLASKRTAWQLAWMAATEFLPERVEVSRLCQTAQRVRATGASPSFAKPESARAAALFRSNQETYVHWCREESRPLVSRQFLRDLVGYSFGGYFMSPPEARGITFTHPFVDRRVLEYIASIPWSVVCEPGRPRALMRDAFGPIVPERIARRFSKGYIAPFFARRASVMVPLLSNVGVTPLVVERGYASASILVKRLEESHAGSPSASQYLVSLGVLERWLTQAAAERRATA